MLTHRDILLMFVCLALLYCTVPGNNVTDISYRTLFVDNVVFWSTANEHTTTDFYELSKWLSKWLQIWVVAKWQPSHWIIALVFTTNWPLNSLDFEPYRECRKNSWKTQVQNQYQPWKMGTWLLQFNVNRKVSLKTNLNILISTCLRECYWYLRW